jgi:hypothetical protein
MFKFIDKTEDSSELQRGCNYLYNWTNKWLMKLNINKCKVLSIGRAGTLIKYKYGFNTAKGFEELEQVARI